MLEQLNSIKEIDKRSYRMTCLIVWLALGLLIVPFAIFIKGIMLEREFTATANQLIIYEPRGHTINSPSEKKLSHLSAQVNGLKELFPQVKEYSTAPGIQRQKQEVVGSALDFKEKLFALKKKLQEKATILNVPFPEEYGLQEYETQLPREEDLSQLFFYVDMVEFFITTLLELPVNEIEFMRFSDVTTRAFSPHDSEYYSVFSIELEFESSYVSVMRFLNSISRAREIHKINSITIQQSDSKEAEEGDLKVAVHLSTFSIV